MKCIDCGHSLIPATTSYKLDSIPPIEVHYLEAFKFQQCGEIYLTRTAMYKIEAIEKKLKETPEVKWEQVST